MNQEKTDSTEFQVLKNLATQQDEKTDKTIHDNLKNTQKISGVD